MEIVIVRFGPVREDVLRELPAALSGRFGLGVKDGPKRPLPETGYNNARGQYLAGAFLKELRLPAAGSADKYLGVTTADLYSRGLNLVFGQADVGGPAAVISLARLSSGQALRERALKEAVHELGHTLGLAHCRDKNCVMWFSRVLTETDFKSDDFCPRHQAELGMLLSGA